MSKLEQLKNAIRSPPPERLAAIEYRSHLLQGIGISFVCIMLIIKGFWYIIFALIFGLGISYSQGMAAYSKYKMIMSMKPKPKLKDLKNEISFTRKRGKIIEHVYGKWMRWGMIVLSVIIAYELIPLSWPRWALMISFPITILSGFILLYYYYAYALAYPKYIHELKGGKK